MRRSSGCWRRTPPSSARGPGGKANALDARDTDFAGGSTSDATGRFLPYWNRGSGAIVREVLTGYEDPVEGAYYQQPKSLSRPAAIEPYIYPVAGKDTMIMSFGAPITVDGKFPRRRRDRHRSVRHEPGRGVGPALRHRLRHPRLCSGRSGGVSGCEGRRQIPRQAGSRGCHGGATGDRDRGARAGGRDRTRFPILALHGRADPGPGRRRIAGRSSLPFPWRR